MDKPDSASLLGHAIGANAVEESFGAWPGHIIFSKARQIEHTDPFGHCLHFSGNRVEAVGAAIAAFFRRAVEREIFRPFPAISFGIHSARRLQRFIKRASLLRTTIRLFLTWQPRCEGHPVIEEHLVAAIIFVGKRAVPARVKFGHVDVGIAVHHPLRQIFARTPALRDPERRTAAMPEVPQSRRWPEQRPAVWRVRDSTVDDPANAYLTKNRHPFNRAFEPFRDAVEIIDEQLAR